MLTDQQQPATQPPKAQSTTLLIRGVDPDLKMALRIQAAQHGHSVQAEIKQILKDNVAPPARQEGPDLAEAIRRLFEPLGGVELEPYPDSPAGEPRVRFDP
jgi:plasmid stability protein